MGGFSRRSARLRLIDEQHHQVERRCSLPAAAPLPPFCGVSMSWFVLFGPPCAHAARGRPNHPQHKVLFVVEGKHDIEFLRRVSRNLHRSDASLPDLANMEQAGRLIFIPFGGGDILGWADRLAGLNESECHLYDREAPPETAIRQQAACIVNARPRCRAFVTKRRSLENYLAASVIQETRGFRRRILRG